MKRRRTSMWKNILITGMTATGKSTIASLLQKDGYEKIITYTTRKPRPGEEDGVDYYFLSNDEFEKRIKDGFFAEYTEYDTSKGHVYYGSSIESYLKEGNKVLVVNSDGLKALKTGKVEADFYGICLICEEVELRKRLTLRGDTKEEQEKRIESDKKFFADIEKYADLIIDTTHLTPEEVLKKITE